VRFERLDAFERNECRCTPTQVERYRSRIRIPLLDCIDIQVEAQARPALGA